MIFGGSWHSIPPIVMAFATGVFLAILAEWLLKSGVSNKVKGTVGPIAINLAGPAAVVVAVVYLSGDTFERQMSFRPDPTNWLAVSRTTGEPISVTIRGQSYLPKDRAIMAPLSVTLDSASTAFVLQHDDHTWATVNDSSLRSLGLFNLAEVKGKGNDWIRLREVAAVWQSEDGARERLANLPVGCRVQLTDTYDLETASYRDSESEFRIVRRGPRQMESTEFAENGCLQVIEQAEVVCQKALPSGFLDTCVDGERRFLVGVLAANHVQQPAWARFAFGEYTLDSILSLPGNDPAP